MKKVLQLGLMIVFCNILQSADDYPYFSDINKQLESYKRVNKVYITTNDFEKTSTQKIKRDFLKNLDINDYTLAN